MQTVNMHDIRFTDWIDDGITMNEVLDKQQRFLLQFTVPIRHQVCPIPMCSSLYAVSCQVQNIVGFTLAARLDETSAIS